MRGALIWARCSILSQLIGLVLPEVADSLCASPVIDILHQIFLQSCWAKMQCLVAACSTRFGGAASSWRQASNLEQYSSAIPVCGGNSIASDTF